MNNHTRNTAAAALALAALLAAGCQRGGNESPTGTGTVVVEPATATTTAPKNLVTPETAGKPVLNLKLGEPVSFRKGGITLTITAKSLEKLDGDPPDLSDSKESCGVWWKVAEQIVVDAEPNATWKNWAVDLSVMEAFQKSPDGGKDQMVAVADPGTGPDRIINQTLPAEAEREKKPSVPFHKTLETKEYYGMCGQDSDFNLTGKPSGLEPLGVDLGIANMHEGTIKPTTIARWLR
jgi:hypothetical protein